MTDWAVKGPFFHEISVIIMAINPKMRNSVVLGNLHFHARTERQIELAIELAMQRTQEIVAISENQSANNMFISGAKLFAETLKDELGMTAESITEDEDDRIEPTQD